MKVLSIIDQLKAYAPYFNGNVAGVAELQRAQDQANMTGTGRVNSVPQQVAPAAYVIRLAADAADNESRTGLRQIVRESFEVLVLIPMTDLLGSGAEISVDAVVEQVDKALLNWVMEPGRTIRSVQRGGESQVQADNLRYWYSIVYDHDILITDADGFPVQGAPLAAINATVPQPKTNFSITFPNPPPQK